MKKRILPALLALCMVMSLLPVAFAEVPEKCSCDGTPTGCSHEKDACTEKTGLSATQAVCNTCKAAKEADESKEESKDTTTTESKNEYVACSAVAAYAKTEEGLKDKEIGSNPHGEATCGASGCQCGIKVTAVTTTKNADGVVTKTETKVTYKYAGALCAACAKNAACNPCTGKDGCPASSHKDGCPVKCYFCANTAGATKVTVGEAEKAICDTCAKDAAKNPCGFGNCSLPAGHGAAHNNSTCPEDVSKKAGKLCGAKTHLEDCADRCKVLDSVKAVDTTTGEELEEQPDSGIKCTLTAGHGDYHNNTVCVKTDKCGAGAHFEGKAAVPAEGKEGEEGYKPAQEAVLGCPSADTKTNPVCGVGGCTRPAKHEGDHANPKCLGYNDDGKCNPDVTHIAGCKKYVECKCTTHTYSASGTDGSWTNVAFVSPGACTKKIDCPHCAAWNQFVTERKAAYNTEKAAWDALDAAEKEKGTAPVEFNLEYCSCVACGAANTNPGMGAVVDADGNPVDPTEPTTPDVPTKAEDFTDMEDWMAADVQVALDKGWLQGNGDGTFNGRGVTTGTTIAAVLARMDGETITGSTWAQDALAWAEDQDVFEGVELTGDSMARKDLVLVLWRMAGTPESEHELDFTDVDGLEGDHLTAMKWAVENGIVKGNGDGTVTPDGSVTRAALCVMLARYDGLEK